MGVAFADYNRDGRTDIFVGNDTVRNFLFENLGGGHFRETGLEAGASLGESGRAVATMGVDFRDYNNDGLPDIVLTANVNDSYQLFRNRPGPDFFDDVTIPSGLSAATRQLTGWGMGMYDFDNERVERSLLREFTFPSDRPLSRRAVAAAEQGIPPGEQSEVSRRNQRRWSALVGRPGYWRGAAFADFDRDGRRDVVVSAMNAPAALFRNVSNGGGHWLAFRLRGIRASSDAIGAEIDVTLEGGVRLFNHVTTSVGYASSSERVVRFGLGSRPRATKVEVRWPGGKKQMLSDVAGDRVVDVQGEIDGIMRVSLRERASAAAVGAAA